MIAGVVLLFGRSEPAAAQVRTFALPSLPAATALPEFGRQAGIQIIAPVDERGDQILPSLTGAIDIDVALARLIASTSFEIASRSPTTIVLRKRAAPSPAAEIIVTGTRMENTAFRPTAPVIRLHADELVRRSGGIAIGDQLSLLPQFRPTVTQAATTAVGVQASGQVGIDLLDLRGLGPGRTLVLMNGRRLVTSTQLVSQPDVNTIPAALLERVDVLTGGAAAVYGPDAMAGVVNFVLRQNFTGVAAEARNGLSERGDAATRTASLVIGKDLGGAGNFAVNLSYAKREALRAMQREFSATLSDFVANPLAGSLGQPSTLLVRDIRSLGISPGGTLAYGAPYLRFQRDGTLRPADLGSRSFPAIGLSDGGDGANPVGNGSLLPMNERLSATVLAHRDLDARSALFGQFDFVWQTAEAVAAPASTTIAVRRDNPFLSAPANTVLDQFGPAAGLATFVLKRTLDDFGQLAERNTRTTIRSLIGWRSRPRADLRLELSYSYGRTGISKDNLGNIDLDRLRLAVDAVPDPAGLLGRAGAIVCRSRLEAARSVDPAIAGCVPANIFGEGAPDRAARRYVGIVTRSTGAFQQHLLSVVVEGATAPLLPFDGGGVRFVAGAEFRRETTRYTPDPRDERGATLVSGQRLAGAIDVYEGFAELAVPLAATRSWAERIEIGAAARISHYGLPGVGTRASWGVNALWQPFPALALKASLQHAVRAPNITELYQPPVTGRGQSVDPCDARIVQDGTPSRPTNCRLLGIPDGFQSPQWPVPVTVTTSGNPALDVERGRSWTVTGTFAPPGSGFSVTVDVYDIVIRGAIAQPGSPSLNPGSVAAGCVDGTSLAADLCDLITRDRATGVLTAIRQVPFNLGRLVASGFDFDIGYRSAPGSGASFATRLLLSHVAAREDYGIPSRPEFVKQIAGTALAPRWQANWTSTLSTGALRLFQRVRALSSVYRRPDDPAFVEALNGQPALDPDRRTAELLKTGVRWYHDLQLGIAVTSDLEMQLGVDNIWDGAPPAGLTGAGTYGTQYDPIGRFFYAGFRWRI